MCIRDRLHQIREALFVSARPERETSFICDYDDMLDEEIVEAARNGEREAEEYLIIKYKNLSLIHI